MTDARTTPPDDEKSPADSAHTASADGDDLAGLGVGDPTDDAPTIITKHTHRSEDLPGGGLRGRRLLHFELIEPIGVGGMAAVIRARDIQLDRLVALKILPPDMAADPENVRRFHQEARSAAKLDHENVARVFFCGEDQHLNFIAFEFVEGDNLRTILERRGRLPVGEALHYILQVAAGLAHAAHRGVVHRDIKPSNIIVTPTGRAKLVDMGLARTMERQDDKGLTQSGVTLGTFDYISPEQALEPREADVRSDIYSLGCTLYHMLTGQPPVPDGTAAKKLHHHQHIKPRDPRELVPGLPDEVAFILDRMMAKNPKDRYQSPEQLVHHLLVAARKAGSAANIPEGVLAVEAPMPHPPGSRPLLLVGVAVGLVVALVVALEVFNRAPAAPPIHPDATHSSAADAKDVKTPPNDAPQPTVVKDKMDKPPPDKGVDPPVAVASDTYTYKDPATPDDLAKWLQARRGAAKIVVRLARDLDLSVNAEGTAAGLLAAAAEVTIQPDKPDGSRPTIRLSYDGQVQNADQWAALTVEADRVAVRGVRFLVDAKGGNVRMAGLVLRGRPAGAAPSFIVENCEFLQFRPLYQENRLASLLVDAAAGPKPTLDLHNSCFFGLEAEPGAGPPEGAAPVRLERGGHDAVVRRGPAVIQAVDCAFGPHAAAFRLEGRAEKDPLQPVVSLTHCTVLLNAASPALDGPPGGAVFDLPGDGGAAIEARACLFSRPQGLDATPPARGAVLIRQADGGAVSFRESDNRYYGLDAYWPLGDERVDWPGFQNVVSLVGGGAPSRALLASPWKGNPLDAFKGFRLLDDPSALAGAFQIDERIPDLRTAGDAAHPVGVEHLGAFSFVDQLAEAAKTPDPLAKKKRVVEPGKNDSMNQIYGSLELAITAAEPGDLILLRFDGPLTVGPIPKKDSLDLRILPDAGRRPVLVFGTREVDSALFRVFDGKLQLEGLEFLLQPTSDEQHSQALVALSGQGQCSLKNCVVTLDPAKHTTTLALATLMETAKMMPTPKPAEMAPQLSLDGCFLRGDGDLITTPANRSFDLKAVNTLAALKGSVVNVERAADASGVMAVHLSRVTTYLGGNLLRLHNRDLKSPPAVKCEASDCLFVASNRDLPLVHLDECDFAKEDIKSKVTWDGARNVYGNYTTMLDQAQPDESMTMVPPVLPDKWDQFWGKSASTGRLVPNFKFAGPLMEGFFKGVLPAQFKAPEGADAGADPASLPQPAPRSPEPK